MLVSLSNLPLIKHSFPLLLPILKLALIDIVLRLIHSSSILRKIFPVFQFPNILRSALFEKKSTSTLSNSTLRKPSLKFKTIILNGALTQNSIIPSSIVSSMSQFRYILTLSLGNSLIKLSLIHPIFVNQGALHIRQYHIASSHKSHPLIYHVLVYHTDLIALLEINKITISMQLPLLLIFITIKILIVYFLPQSLKGRLQLRGHPHQYHIEINPQNLSIKSILFLLMRRRYHQSVFVNLTLLSSTMFATFISLEIIYTRFLYTERLVQHTLLILSLFLALHIIHSIILLRILRYRVNIYLGFRRTKITVGCLESSHYYFPLF